MRRWLKILGVLLLALPLLVLAMAGFTLRTEAGAGWLLEMASERLPGLAYSRHEGSLSGGLSLYEPAFSQDGLEVRAERLELVVEPGLFPLQVRVRNIEAAGLVVMLPPEGSSNEGSALPDSLALPLTVEVEQLRIQGLSVLEAGGDSLLGADRFAAAATLSDRVLLRQAELVLPGGSLEALGDIALNQPFAAHIEASGRYEHAWAGGPKPLRIEGTANLEGTFGAYRLVVDGSAILEQLQVNASGLVDLQDTSFEGRAEWRDFSWPVLEETKQVESRRGSVELSGWLDGWRAEGQAELVAPGLAGGDLSFHAEGDAERVHLVVPEGRVLGGRVAGEGEYQIPDGGAFSARLDLEEVDTAPLYPDLPAVLSGGLSLEGRIEPLSLELTASGLQARMDARTILADGRAAFRPDELVFEGFTLRSAGSRVELDGSLDRPGGIEFLADVPDLSAFLEGVSGRVAGSGRYALAEGSPRLELDLEGEGVAWQDLQAARVSVVAAPIGGTDSMTRLDVELGDVLAGEAPLERVVLQADVGRSSQDLGVTVQHEGYRLTTRLPGAVRNLDDPWRDWRWRGELTVVRLEGTQGVLLVQEEPTALDVSLENATLQSICFAVAERARACGEGRWSATSGAAARAALESVPLDLLGLASGALELSQALDGEAEFTLDGAQGSRAEARFRLSPGAVHYAGDPRPVFETGEGVIGLKMVEGAITSGTFDLPITGQGRIDFDYSVDNLEAGLQAPVNGRLVADFEDLDVLAVFLPIADELRGRLDADLLLSGTLGDPALRGRLDLVDGFIRHAASGMVLSDIQVSGQVDGRDEISLSGRFQAAEGQGNLEGLADISDLLAPSVSLDLVGDGLVLFDTDDLVLEADPDIRLSWYEGALHVDGQLTVPRALLAPTVLPVTPVLESPDVEIVAGALPQSGPAPSRRPTVAVYGGLDVVLGDEVDIDLSVTEADLAGHARFEWNGPVLPVADGEFDISGLILAYGQRLEITQGRIVFPGVPADNPHLNIRAEREIFGNSEVRRAGLWVTGTLQRLQIEPYTTPMTTRDRAQTLLVTGSDFNMERGSGAVSVGTYIAPRIFVSYGVGVFDDDRVISFRYDLGRGWGVMATSGERQTGVDMSYTIER